MLAIQELGVKNFFDVDLWQDPNGFTDDYVKQYAAIIFLNTTDDIFDSAQQKVMERYIESGKGYVGIHSAADTEYDWDWYTKLVGRMFHIHPTIQTAKLNVLDNNFPACKALVAEDCGRKNGISSDWKDKRPALYFISGQINLQP